MSVSEPWRGGHVITAEVASALVQAQFPELAPVRLTPLGAGWDNTVFLANDAWVFRFPRRALALGLLEAELRALPTLGALLPVAVPRPRYHGVPTPTYPYPFTGYSLVPGITACRAALTPAQRAALAPDLATVLRLLHGVPPSRAATLAGPDPFGRFDVARRAAQARQALDALAVAGLLPPAPALEALLEDVPAAPGPAVLVHGDLYARHLVLQRDGRLAGIIDWGDVHLGHPATDLALVYSFLPASARAAFTATYGAIDTTTERLARFRALYHSLSVLRYAHDIGDGDLEREARHSVAAVAE